MKKLLLLCFAFLSLVVKNQAQNIFDNQIRYLALGDSYTIGQSVAIEERWPNQLAKRIENEYNIKFNKVDIIAQTGWRTDNLINAVQNQKPDSSYNLVSLLIGVNNFYQGRDEKQYVQEFEYLLTTAIALAGGNNKHVFVVSIPDYAYTPFGKGNESISQKTNRYNFIADSISTLYQIEFHNITPISRQGLQNPDLVADDNLHPSGEQYQLWVKQIMENIQFSEILYNSEEINKTTINYIIYNNTLELLNTNGKTEGMIFNTEGKKIMDFNSSKINLYGLKKGIYIITLKTDNGIWNKKFSIK